VNISMANTGRGRKPIKRVAGQRMVDGKNFRLADEVRYILGRAAEHDGRVITIGQIILFPPKRAMRFRLTLLINSPHGWPAMATPNHSTSKKTRRPSSKGLSHWMGRRKLYPAEPFQNVVPRLRILSS
jgi:hypothetical protein